VSPFYFFRVLRLIYCVCSYLWLTFIVLFLCAGCGWPGLGLLLFCLFMFVDSGISCKSLYILFSTALFRFLWLVVLLYYLLYLSFLLCHHFTVICCFMLRLICVLFFLVITLLVCALWLRLSFICITISMCSTVLFLSCCCRRVLYFHYWRLPTLVFDYQKSRQTPIMKIKNTTTTTRKKQNCRAHTNSDTDKRQTKS
jgi:hypothetical protein